MDQKNRNRLEAILGMLGSEHDGERASAGLMIFRMALKRKLTIPELMREAFKPEDTFETFRASSDFESAMRTAQAYAEREREAARRAENFARETRWFGARDILDDLVEVDRHHTQYLNEWEKEFIRDVADRVSEDADLTTAQLEVIKRIKKKIQRKHAEPLI